MSRNTGFTLIELLVVIAIISILIAITYPILTASASRTYECECESHLQQLALAMNAYVQDNGCFPARLSNVDSVLQDKNVLECPRTSKQYFYVCPKPNAARDTAIATCVNPAGSRSKLPHRSASAYLALTVGGGVKRISK